MSSFELNFAKSKKRNNCNCSSIEKVWGKGNPDYDGTLSVIVLGASGNLAMLKVYRSVERIDFCVDISSFIFLVSTLLAALFH